MSITEPDPPKPADAAALAPATPLAKPTTPPPLGRVLFLCVLWWIVIVAHFLACGRAAYAIGHPDLIPGWLEGIDEFFQNGISIAVDLILLLIWWAIVVVVLIPGWFLVDLVNRRTAPVSAFEKPADSKTSTPTEAALVEALCALAPMLVMSILSLFILPAQAPNHYEFDSGMEMANELSYAGFVEYQYLSIIAMLVIFAMAAGFCFGVWLVVTYYPEAGIPTFLLVILFAIAVALAAGLGLGPFLGDLPERYGIYRATAILLAAIALGLSPPTLFILRQVDKK